MSYSIPPNVAEASVAKVIGNAVVNILPAPGAGSAYRIVGVHFRFDQNATGETACDIRDAGTTFKIARGGLGVASGRFCDVTIPEPGIVVSIGQAVQFVVSSTTAVGTCDAIVYYFLDAST